VHDAALVAAIEAELVNRGSRRAGDEVRYRCAVPEHEDRNPSARWHPQRAVWWCDVCGVGGGAVGLARLLSIGVGHRAVTVAERRSLARRSAERRERDVLTSALRADWLGALAQLRQAQADVLLLRALVCDDAGERDRCTKALLDEIGDAYLREQIAEQRLDEIERADRALREGLRRAAV
jgi:hypothetical protein